MIHVILSRAFYYKMGFAGSASAILVVEDFMNIPCRVLSFGHFSGCQPVAISGHKAVDIVLAILCLLTLALLCMGMVVGSGFSSQLDTIIRILFSPKSSELFPIGIPPLFTLFSVLVGVGSALASALLLCNSIAMPLPVPFQRPPMLLLRGQGALTQPLRFKVCQYMSFGVAVGLGPLTVVRPTHLPALFGFLAVGNAAFGGYGHTWSLAYGC